jgi:predicted transglutaminase-like cysteine proteinase
MDFSWIRAALAATLLVLAPVAAFAGPLFDATPADPDMSGFVFWQAVLSDSPRDAACNDQRHCAPKTWTGFLATLRGQDARAQLDAVNRWANAHPHVEDSVNWSLPDYWETPGEFIARGGDCEDFAIAKYFSLVRLGISPRDLRIVIVSDSRSHSFHAVLAARSGGATLILDDQAAEVTSLTALPHYVPIYSLGDQGWWLHSAPVIHAEGGTLVAEATPSRLVK